MHILRYHMKDGTNNLNILFSYPEKVPKTQKNPKKQKLNLLLDSFNQLLYKFKLELKQKTSHKKPSSLH